jgi:hypothetical protein
LRRTQHQTCVLWFTRSIYLGYETLKLSKVNRDPITKQIILFRSQNRLCLQTPTVFMLIMNFKWYVFLKRFSKIFPSLDTIFAFKVMSFELCTTIPEKEQEKLHNNRIEERKKRNLKFFAPKFWFLFTKEDFCFWNIFHFLLQFFLKTFQRLKKILSRNLFICIFGSLVKDRYLTCWYWLLAPW